MSEADNIKEAARQVCTYATAMDAFLAPDWMASLSQLAERPNELVACFDAIDELHDAAEMLLAVTARWKNAARLKGDTNV